MLHLEGPLSIPIMARLANPIPSESYIIVQVM
jgi:hypothetical protein